MTTSGAGQRLTEHDVLSVVHARAVTKPLSTLRIVELCEAAYPGRTGIDAVLVRRYLRWWLARGQVWYYHGKKHRAQLELLGVTNIEPHRAYWMRQ